MAIENIVTSISLDVYDHDRTPTTIKTIALDKQTRYVQARLYWMDTVYQPPLGATVELIAVRPDKVGVQGTGSVIVVDDTDSENLIYGVQGEMTQTMLAVQGTVLFQFKMTFGNQILRTEIFKSENGRALDGDISDWADTYQGYNLDDLVQKVDAIGLGGIAIEGNVLKITSISQAASEYHTYVNTKLAELRADLGRKVTTTDSRIDIITRGGAS